MFMHRKKGKAALQLSQSGVELAVIVFPKTLVNLQMNKEMCNML